MAHEERGPKTPKPWSWHPSLYSGSATHYTRGRVAYPPELVEELVQAVPLDGSGTLLDVGCGPGSLTLLLAPCVAQAIGVDADPDMLAEAARRAEQQHVRNATWRHLRAEDLPADLPSPQVVTFAQSFHWMVRSEVAATVRAMLAADGAMVHVGATTDHGLDGDAVLQHPRPPRRAITALVERYLRKSPTGVQSLLAGRTPGDEDDVFRAAGFTGPERIEVPGRVVERTAEDVASSVYSLSGSTPHLFGDRLAAFDEDLRRLLAASSDDGLFSEEMRSITLSLWRPATSQARKA